MHRRISETFPDREIIRKTYERVCNFLHVSIGEGFDTVREFDIFKFCNLFKVQERQCRASLRLLSQAGYLNFIEDPDSRSRLKIIVDREDLYDINDLSEKAESVLSATLRLYTGLFSDYVYVREPEIADRVNLPEEEVYESMLELSRRKVLSYIPHSGIPMIYFPTAREETSSVLIGKDIYENRKDNMKARTDAMLDYAFNSRNCRVERMLSYFGENDAGDCLKCDVCRDKSNKGNSKKESTESFILKITEFLNAHPEGATIMMIEKICGDNSGRSSSVLAFLCNEGFVRNENGIYRLVE